MKIAVVGLGYVGISNAILLSQNHCVVGIDLDENRVNLINQRISPLDDSYLKQILESEKLNLSATQKLAEGVSNADFVIIATPTNYDEVSDSFDTSSVENVIYQISLNEPKATIIIKSTIPIGFTDRMRARHNNLKIIFSPEFLREGNALYDNHFPSRIIIGDQSVEAQCFAKILSESAIKNDVDICYMGTREAEAVKLFANTFLAMRVAFFNELDTYALIENLNPKQIINGVSLDPRIGQHYNNPSFGYGGYCLPKDTKQLLANFAAVPQTLVGAVVESNDKRKQALASHIISQKPKVVGIYRLVMKAGSDNLRQSAIFGIIDILRRNAIKVIAYEPVIETSEYNGITVLNELQEFKASADIVIANRITQDLSDIKEKLFTRDLFGVD